MEIKYQELNRTQVEQLAFTCLRGEKDKKLLSNTAVDCFVMGFYKASSVLSKQVSTPQEYVETLISEIRKTVKMLEDNAGYGGRYLTHKEVEQIEVLGEIENALTKVTESPKYKQLI